MISLLILGSKIPDTISPWEYQSLFHNSKKVIVLVIVIAKKKKNVKKTIPDVGATLQHKSATDEVGGYDLSTITIFSANSGSC